MAHICYPEPGESLYQAVTNILGDKERYFRSISEVTLIFNGISLRIFYQSYEYDIYEKYDLLRKLKNWEKF